MFVTDFDRITIILLRRLTEVGSRLTDNTGAGFLLHFVEEGTADGCGTFLC